MIAAFLALLSFLLFSLPAAIASWWALFSNEPFFVWLGKHQLPWFAFSPLYVLTPAAGLGFVMLCVILWALFSPSLRERSNKNHGLLQIIPQSPPIDRRLRMSCHPSIEGCVKETKFTSEQIPTNFFRVKVEAEGGEMHNCTAYLTRIAKNGKARWGGDSAKITFAQGEASDAFSKTIRSKVPEFFDVLAVTNKGQMFPGTFVSHFGRIWPYHPKLAEIFSELGDYFLDVAVTGDGVPTETGLLKFSWTGNWKTSSLTLIPPESLATSQIATESEKRTAKNRSPAVIKVVDEAVRLLRGNTHLYTLHALQQAGVGNLNTEEEFLDAREALIQHNFPDPLLGEALWPEKDKPKWLHVIKSANRKRVDLSSPLALLDFLAAADDLQGLLSKTGKEKPKLPLWEISYEQETEMLAILRDSPKDAVMVMATKGDRVGNHYAMRLVQVLRKTGMEIGQCVFEESWRLPTGVNVWASDFADNRQISKLRAAIKATNMECGDAPGEPPTVSSPTRYEINIMVKSSRT